MENLQYIECQKCGTIHYVVNEEQAKTLVESKALFGEFPARNLKCCSNCGCENQFLKVTEEYADEYLQGDKIPPILYTNGELVKEIKV